MVSKRCSRATDDELEKIIETWCSHDRDVPATATALKLSVEQLRRRLGEAKFRGMLERDKANATRLKPVAKTFSYPTLPDEDTPVEEIINRRTREFGRRAVAADARKLIRVTVDDPGPIGLAFIGDPHVDNPGCNLPMLLSHIELIKKTDGLYAGCVGDLQDGWVGRLARLWATQGISSRESLKLVQYFMEELAEKLIFIIQGNHDAWCAGINGVSPVDWIAAHTGTLTQNDGVRISIDLHGDHSWVINGRHHYPGKSQWNAAHGMAKAAMMGWRDDILVGGHTHESGYQVVKDPKTGKVTHALRIASYKHLDHYAQELGFPDNNSFECPVAILRPDAKDQRFRTQIITDPFYAAECLTVARRKRK